MKILLVILAVLVGLLIVVESGLRLLFGFGNPPIYIADPEIGYLLAPNQRTRRFGNRIVINQYSMRSPAIAPQREASTLRLLLLGDSIANGGWWTDQGDTLSALMTQQLQLTQSSYRQVEVLNASANSWGPRNELAYLNRFGAFEAQAVVLLINTDDLFATAPTAVPVGRDRNYPDRKPFLKLALAEIFSRYLAKPPAIPELKTVNAEGGDRVGFNLEAIEQIKRLVEATGAKFLLAMTPLKREIGEPGSRDYELKARSRLVEFTKNQQITYVDFLPIFNDTQMPETLYHDHIHLSPQGYRLINEVIGRSLQILLSQTTNSAP
ncbi:MAG TPA: SGNH/GDSL hydrolase family protein [Coleofasciculaceae cyanobacterium]